MSQSLIRRLTDQLNQDLAYAARGLRRAPVFTVIVAVTLSLGIGANAAIIGAIDTLFFRKLPVPDPERIVGIYKFDRRDVGKRQSGSGYSSAPLLRDLRSRIRGVEGLGGYTMQSFNAGDALAGDFTWGALVSGNYFSLFGIKPQRGRFIRPDEEEVGVPHPVVVISDYVWREKFAADEAVLGRTIPIGKGTFTIIGIAPPGFTGMHPEGRTNVWIPFTAEAAITGGTGAAFTDRAGRPLQVFGRLVPGATVAEVQASADVAARELAAAHPATDSLLAFRVEVRDRLTTVALAAWGFSWSMFVWVVVALLHLVACSNVASLMLARASARRRELGVRMCLGASRRRILAQSLTEAGLLAALGAAGGLLVGRWLSALIAKMQFMSTTNPGLDPRVVAIVILVTVATVFQFGLLPALDASRSDPLAVLRGASMSGRSKHSRAEMVVVSQIAISMLLIANAAVFLGLLRRQTQNALGFDAEHLVVASIDPRQGPRFPADWAARYNEAMARVATVSGVRAVAASGGAPLYRPTWTGELSVPGRVGAPDEQRSFSLQLIGPGYFSAIGTPLVSGREFTNDERADPAAKRFNEFTSVVVNETLARRFWPNGDALGKQLVRSGSPPATVVGIVRDIYDVGTTSVRPRAYFPLLQFAYPSFELVVRVSDDPVEAANRVRSALSASALLERPMVRTMASIRDDATSTSRLGSLALGVCAAIALLLASIGLYGLVAMWTARRRSEIGIRLALGATSAHVHTLLMKEVGKLVGAGSVIGLICAFGLVQVERGWMGPVVSLDVVTVFASLATFAAIGGVAAFVPSLRATRQSPAEVLRS